MGSVQECDEDFLKKWLATWQLLVCGSTGLCAVLILYPACFLHQNTKHFGKSVFSSCGWSILFIFRVTRTKEFLCLRFCFTWSRHPVSSWDTMVFPVISSRKEHARFLMIVAAEMARHMHGHCHSGSLAIVNSRRAGFKKMKDDFLCSTSENWTCAVFEVPCQKSKLELLRKDRIRKTWQPCVQPWLELQFRQNATCEHQSAFF